MKIIPYSLVPGSRQDRVEQSARNDLVNFNRVLNRMLGQSSPSPAGATTASPTATGSALAADSQTLLVKRMDNFLSMLEGFRAKMANPSTPLKELHPAAEKIESEINALSLTLDTLPAKGGIAQSLKKALNAAATDVARFRSGAYLAIDARASVAH